MITTRGVVAVTTGTALLGVGFGIVAGQAVAVSEPTADWSVDTAADQPPSNLADLTALEEAYATVAAERDAALTLARSRKDRLVSQRDRIANLHERVAEVQHAYDTVTVEYAATYSRAEAADEQNRLLAGNVEALEAEQQMLVDWLREAEAERDMADEVISQSRMWEDGSFSVVITHDDGSVEWVDGCMAGADCDE